jgi:hypothetical protein
VKGGIPVGGYEQRLQDTSCRDLVWRNLQDLKEKLPYLICTDRRKMASGTPWPANSLLLASQISDTLNCKRLG